MNPKNPHDPLAAMILTGNTRGLPRSLVRTLQRTGAIPTPPVTMDRHHLALLGAIHDAGSVTLRELPLLARRAHVAPPEARERAEWLVQEGLLTRPGREGVLRVTPAGIRRLRR